VSVYCTPWAIRYHGPGTAADGGTVKRWRIGLPGLLISLLATGVLLTQLDLAQLAAALRSARYGWLAPAFLLLLAGQLARALRWQALLADGLALRPAFHTLNISYLANAFLPLRMGELARIWLVRPAISSLQAAGSVLLERTLDTLAVLLLLAAALSVIPGAGVEYQAAARLLLLLLPAVTLVLFLLAQQRGRAQQLLATLLRIPLPGRLRSWPWHAWLEALLDGLQTLTRPGLLLRVLGWTVIGWGLSLAASYLLMQVFHEQASLAVATLGLVAAALVIAVPAVPGNFGPYEWAIMLALAYGGYGRPTDAANISLAVTVHALNLLVYVLTGALGLASEGVTPAGLLANLREFRIRQEHDDRGPE